MNFSEEKEKKEKYEYIKAAILNRAKNNRRFRPIPQTNIGSHIKEMPAIEKSKMRLDRIFNRKHISESTENEELQEWLDDLLI